MKIRMTNSYRIVEVYDTIEIDPNEYEELAGLSEKEVIEYLNENCHDFCLKDGAHDTIYDEFRFERDIVKDKTNDEEATFFIVE